MSVNRPLTGAEYIESLKDGREVWIYEEKVKDVTEHPAFRNPIRSIARLYDSLHEPTGHDGSMPTAETDTVSGGVAAEERVKTLKMLWDAVGTEFGGRHELYERNYQGNHEQIRVSIFGAGEGRGWNKQLVAFAEQAMSEYDTEGWTLPELQLSPGDLGPRGPPVCGAAPDRKTATLSGAAPHEFRSICQPGAVPVLSLSAAGPESFWSRGTQGPFRLGPARHTANSVLAQSATRTIYVPLSATGLRGFGHECHEAKRLSGLECHEANWAGGFVCQPQSFWPCGTQGQENSGPECHTHDLCALECHGAKGFWP